MIMALTKFQCNTCKKNFTRLSNLKAHKQTHQSARKKIPCPKCSKKFTRKGALKDHIMNIHKIKNYDKILSEAEFVVENKINVESNHFCKICRKSFTRKENLNYHMKATHRKKKNINVKSRKSVHCAVFNLQADRI